MRRYETIFIADPDLSQEVRDNLFEKTQSLISTNGGDLVDFDEWGNRRLAYEVRKKMRGHYVRLDYCGDGAAVSALENAFRIDERVFKFMTILLEETADPEQLKAALAEQKAAKAEASAVAETAEETTTEAAAETPAETPAAPAETVAEEAPKADSAEEE